ncbi:PLP-dependent aminotransferase family protein [Methylopila turkensis]|uniref:GntR family transcriptional regulator n=1 Tax=Methylopila turkensis TaxID=1437816 RepID=A0A9W6JJ54_9HYPH|nr:PLP-dependent aminotransferase family protein [Methylopila turkensis]GLK78631.1 GntR family transcriptional regulator [Methylopila turkensis]
MSWPGRIVLSDSSPYYLQIADAIEAAADAGRLRPGDRLPPQRALAQELDVDLTTVTRAYAEARRRGLLDAVTGRGSFIAARPDLSAPAIDLSMNIPPAPRGVSLADAIARGVADIAARANVDTLMSYHSGPGAPQDRAAAAVWLKPALGRIDDARIAVSPGAQTALAALLSLHAQAGDAVLAEPLCYPGLLLAVSRLGLKTVAVESDADGMRPDALERAARGGARVVYLNPTIANPTAATMPEARRRDIAAAAARHGLTIIEDDPCARLAEDAPPAFATVAPAATWHVATLSKCLTPGLRTAYVVAPDEEGARRFAAAMRAFALMPAPLMTALATFWIRRGDAETLLRGVREEAAARQALARDILPGARGARNGLHLWLPLPTHWDRYGLIEAARAQGLGVTPSDEFRADGAAPEAVRVSLGGVADRARLAAALKTLAALVQGERRRVHDVV